MLVFISTTFTTSLDTTLFNSNRSRVGSTIGRLAVLECSRRIPSHASRRVSSCFPLATTTPHYHPHTHSAGIRAPLASEFRTTTLPHRLRYPLHPTMPAKKRCQFGASTDAHCQSAALRIIGQCAMCKSAFCGEHRMPEQHDCSQLQSCKQEAFSRNEAKLLENKHATPKLQTV